MPEILRQISTIGWMGAVFVIVGTGLYFHFFLRRFGYGYRAFTVGRWEGWRNFLFDCLAMTSMVVVGLVLILTYRRFLMP